MTLGGEGLGHRHPTGLTTLTQCKMNAVRVPIAADNGDETDIYYSTFDPTPARDNATDAVTVAEGVRGRGIIASSSVGCTVAVRHRPEGRVCG